MANILEVKNLKKYFGGVHAVDGMDFHVEKDEILGLIGPNGCGKSTCVNLISGVYTEDSGEIVFEGKPIDKKTSIPKRSKMGIGRTFQSPKPFIGVTVFDSVYTVAIQTRSMQEAKQATEELLEYTGLAPLSSMLSEKLPIEKRKALDLTRILANEPKLIMLDEVMAGLNPAEMDESIELVRKINARGITVLFIEHVMRAVVELSHRVIVMNSGALLTEGQPADVMNNPAVITAYLGEGYHA